MEEEKYKLERQDKRWYATKVNNSIRKCSRTVLVIYPKRVWNSSATMMQKLPYIIYSISSNVLAFGTGSTTLKAERNQGLLWFIGSQNAGIGIGIGLAKECRWKTTRTGTFPLVVVWNIGKEYYRNVTCSSATWLAKIMRNGSCFWCCAARALPPHKHH